MERLIKATFNLPENVVREVRAASRALAGPPVFCEGVSHLVAQAIASHVATLMHEHNSGVAFAATAPAQGLRGPNLNRRGMPPRENVSVISVRLRQAVLARDGHKCVYCGAGDNLVLDHVVPVSRGGDRSMENLVAACRTCNGKKSDSDPEAFEVSHA